MPRKIRGDEALKHEPPTAFTEEGESFSDDRESRIVLSAPTGKKGKRSVEVMMASMATPEAQAMYAMERIASAEDQIAKVFKLAMDETKEIILKRRPSLKRYVETEE